MTAPSPGWDAGAGLRFEGCTIGYGDAPVLSGLELAVEPGGFVAMIGPNGVGKTTCLRAVTGSARVLEGRVLVGGRPVDRMSARERARGVGVLPQVPPIAFAFRSVDFVAMGRHPHLGRLAAPDEGDDEVVRRAMERTDTLRLEDVPVSALSGGDYQRLLLAQALAQEPDVLLLDEPTSHLDINHRLQILDLVRDLADEGMAVLGIFHDLDLAGRYGDRVAVLHDGRLVVDAAPEEALTPAMLSSVFDVKALVGVDPATGRPSISPLIRTADIVEPTGLGVLIVGGSGTASWLMRRLLLDGHDVRMAAVNDGDTDAEIADVLGVPRIALPPFAVIDEPVTSLVSRAADDADVVVVCDAPFGRGNVGNLTALEGRGSKVVLVGEMRAERDLTGGEAVASWDRLLDEGARVVADHAEAAAFVAEGAWRR